MADLVRIGALGGSRALAAGVGFLAVWQIAARLGPEALGVWSIGLACFGFALHVSEWGLRSVITAEAGADRMTSPALLARYLKLRMSTTLLVAIIVFTGTSLFWPNYQTLMALLLLCTFAVGLMLDWIALVDDKLLIAGGCLLVRPIGFCFILWLVPSLDTPILVAAAFATAWWLAAAVTWPLGRGLKPAKAPPKSQRELLTLGVPLMGNTMINQMQLSLDLLLVGLLAGAALAGQYYLAAAIAAAGLVFAHATAQIATARMARFRGDPAAFQAELRRKLLITVAVALGLAAGLVFIGRPLMPILFGAEFKIAGTLLLWFVPWFVLAGISSHMQGALTANLQQKLISFGNLALIAGLIPALAVAWLLKSPEAFAVARGVAEATRLIVLTMGSGILVSAGVQIPSWLSTSRH